MFLFRFDLFICIILTLNKLHYLNNFHHYLNNNFRDKYSTLMIIYCSKTTQRSETIFKILQKLYFDLWVVGETYGNPV